MRLTEHVRRQVLELNEGFTTQTYYEGKNSRESRTYTIIGGELRIRATGKTSWADSHYDNEFVANKDATLRYLRQHLYDLDLDDVDETAPPKPKPTAKAAPVGPADYPTHSDAEDEYEYEPAEHNPDYHPDPSGRAILIAAAIAAATVAAVVAARRYGKPVWDNRVQPAIERRRAKRKAVTTVEPNEDETLDAEPDTAP